MSGCLSPAKSLELFPISLLILKAGVPLKTPLPREELFFFTAPDPRPGGAAKVSLGAHYSVQAIVVASGPTRQTLFSSLPQPPIPGVTPPPRSGSDIGFHHPCPVPGIAAGPHWDLWLSGAFIPITPFLHLGAYCTS